MARRRIANSHNPTDEDTLDEEDGDMWHSKPKRPKTKRNGSVGPYQLLVLFIADLSILTDHDLR